MRNCVRRPTNRVANDTLQVLNNYDAVSAELLKFG